METLKEDLYNTNLPVLVIEKNKLYRRYRQIGSGDEGLIYRYNNKIAFKTFEIFKDKEKLSRKFKKIELLGQMQDENACFPIGLIGYQNKQKEGYYYQFVKTNENLKDFDLLLFLKNMKKKLRYIDKASNALKRYHQIGLILGDIKGNNIMIDTSDNVKFIDTDNWMFDGYDFDLTPVRSTWLSRTYGKNFSLVDNDRFVFAMMSMQILLNEIVLYPNDRFLKRMIKYLNVSKVAKDGLGLIFSDAINKPYIDEVLSKINPEEEIISKKLINKLNRIF